MQSKKGENAPGVKMHFASDQTHPLKDTLCLAQPPTHPAAFQPSPLPPVNVPNANQMLQNACLKTFPFIW